MNLSEIYKIARDIYSGKTLHGFNGYVTLNDDVLSIVFKKTIKGSSYDYYEQNKNSIIELNNMLRQFGLKYPQARELPLDFGFCVEYDEFMDMCYPKLIRTTELVSALIYD